MSDEQLGPQGHTRWRWGSERADDHQDDVASHALSLGTAGDEGRGTRRR